MSWNRLSMLRFPYSSQYSVAESKGLLLAASGSNKDRLTVSISRYPHIREYILQGVRKVQKRGL